MTGTQDTTKTVKAVDAETGYAKYRAIMDGNGSPVSDVLNFNTGGWYADNRQPISAVMFEDGAACFYDHARGIFGWLYVSVPFTKAGIMQAYHQRENEGWGGVFFDITKFDGVQAVEFDKNTMVNIYDY